MNPPIVISIKTSLSLCSFIHSVFKVRLPPPKHFCSFFIAVKKRKKYTSVFGLLLPMKAKKLGSEAVDRPL